MFVKGLGLQSWLCLVSPVCGNWWPVVYSFCFTAVNKMMDDTCTVTKLTVVVLLGLLLLDEVELAEDGLASADFRDFRFPDQIESRLTKEVGEKLKQKTIEIY